MKILFVVNGTKDHNGYDRYAKSLSDALQASGHEVCTIGDVLGSNGGHLHASTSYCTKRSPFFLDVPVLQKAINKYRPDIIHFVIEPYIALLPFVRVGTARCVLTVHGTYSYPPALISGFGRGVYRAIYRRAFVRIYRIIAVSHFTQALLLKRAQQDGVNFLDKKITVIPNGIESERYTPVTHHNKVFTILTVAPLTARKGILEALQALVVLRARGMSFTWRIIGRTDTGAYADKVRSEIDKQGLKDRVTFLGLVDEETLKKEYQHADVFVMLPVENGLKVEGFGLVYLEANASGTPVIGSINSGAEEAIKDGISGYLVNPNDSQAVADAIERVAQNSINPTEMNHWAKTHDIKVSSNTWLNVCDNI